MTFIAGAGFWRPDANAGGGSSGCDFITEILFTRLAEADTLVQNISQIAGVGAGTVLDVPVPVDEGLLDGLEQWFTIRFDRNGCTGPISFEISATAGLFDASSPTQLGTTYVVPATRSAITVVFEYANPIAVGTYTITVDAECDTCSSSTTLTFEVTAP